MTVNEPTVALVFSPERWVEEVHRYLADHGGARVRQIVVEPSVALDEEYDTLVVSDRWPALTRGLVDAVHQRARCVLGVYDPEEPAGKDHLLGLGVDATIASDAPMAEFVAAIVELAPRGDGTRAVPTPDSVAALGSATDATGPRRGRLTVVSGPRGSGVTEIALALAGLAANRQGPAVLLDAHDAAPSLAGRLGLDVEPNLRGAVDALVYGNGRVDHAVGRGPANSGFDVVSGFPSPAAAAQVTPSDVLSVVDALRASYRLVVVDADATPTSPIGRAVIGESTSIVGVGSGCPVGIARLLAWVADARSMNSQAPIHLVVNRSPRDRFRRAEIDAEIGRTFAPSSITFASPDRQVEAAAWDGRAVVRGAFVAALVPLAMTLVPSSPTRRTRSSRRANAKADR